MNDVLVFAFLFFMGSCIGWGIELFYRKFLSQNNPQRKWINPGFLVGPYLPLYGFGLWGMYAVSKVYTKFLSDITTNFILDTIFIFIFMCIIMTIIEYIAGLIFIRGMHLKLWDYTQCRFNLQGIICLKFSLAWGLLGLVYFYAINPHVLKGIIWLSNHLSFSFFVGMFFGVFAVDICYTFHVTSKIRQFAKEQEIIIRYEELKHQIAIRRDELNERGRFILSFKSQEPIIHHLESYLETFKARNAENLEKIKENVSKLR